METSPPPYSEYPSEPPEFQVSNSQTPPYTHFTTRSSPPIYQEQYHHQNSERTRRSTVRSQQSSLIVSPPAVLTQPTSDTPIRLAVFEKFPANVICPFCHRNVTTVVKTTISSQSENLAITLCIVTCGLCVWIPYYCCQQRIHYCPSCSHYLGSDDVMD